MVPEYIFREDISPQYLSYWHQCYQQKLPDQLLYTIIYIPVHMRYVCRWYYLRTYRYTYRIRIIIKSYNYWYNIIWYVLNKTVYSHIYSSTHDVRAQMILTEQLLLHILDETKKPILLPYVSTLYAKYNIYEITDISACK